ncbi:MAG: hypothetical protein Q9N67_03005 [Ghiorsea sp.]|nr:hypothetical protein [Ghiorsea sp.]
MIITLTEKAITAVGAGITVPAGSEILGGVAVDISASPTLTAPVTLLFKAGSAALTSMVYAVDTYAIATADPYAMNTTLPLAATDWSLTLQGAVQINQLPAGADATYDIVVTRVIPMAPITPQAPIVPSNTGDDSGVETEGGETEGDSNTTNATLPACVGDVSTIPLLMFLALLLPIFIKNHRKKII